MNHLIGTYDDDLLIKFKDKGKVRFGRITIGISFVAIGIYPKETDLIDPDENTKELASLEKECGYDDAWKATSQLLLTILQAGSEADIIELLLDKGFTSET